MHVVREIKQRPVLFGGDHHFGWLPEAAMTPASTPARTVLIDLAIVE